MLTEPQIAATGDWLAAEQLADGMLPWYRGGHADPWNHVEALMALAACDRWDAVALGLSWLADKQLEDGSWCTFYVPGGVTDPRRDPNVCAYIATGVWWLYRLSGDEEVVREMWPVVDRAISWCLQWQRSGGEMAWSVGPDGVAGQFGLVTASSSFQHSLRCAVRAARVVGQRRPQWEIAAERVARAVAGHVGSSTTGHAAVFADKERWAMDWYYPVLTGVLEGEAACLRLKSRWDQMVETGLGVRCVGDQFWVTAAETAECAMAASRAGMMAEGRELLDWANSHMRDISGGYWTGCAHPDCVRFPGGQLSTYSAAAAVIADHVLAKRSPAASVFCP
ncbi:MAG TPA: hypothetical protein VFN61_13145 [Acidimicrobiales bacterium]|nr:hypothetical protein [Acidimicrobiales bacterium]